MYIKKKINFALWHQNQTAGILHTFWRKQAIRSRLKSSGELAEDRHRRDGSGWRGKTETALNLTLSTSKWLNSHTEVKTVGEGRKEGRQALTTWWALTTGFSVKLSLRAGFSPASGLIRLQIHPGFTRCLYMHHHKVTLKGPISNSCLRALIAIRGVHGQQSRFLRVLAPLKGQFDRRRPV